MLVVLVIAATVSVKAPPPVVRTGCDPTRFVTRAYKDLLGRTIDPAGTAYWLGVMKNGASREQVASALMRSGEYRNRQVQSLFSTYLHRTAGGGDLAHFSGMLQNGNTTEQVEASIVASAEYFAQRGGGTNQGFVAALYQDVLGRAADPQGLAVFMQQLGAGASRASIAQQLLTSPEARQHWISALFTRYLHRPSSGGALPGSQDQVTAIIIGSEEYCRQSP